jgi:hypothetical protein
MAYEFLPSLRVPSSPASSSSPSSPGSVPTIAGTFSRALRTLRPDDERAGAARPGTSRSTTTSSMRSSPRTDVLWERSRASSASSAGLGLGRRAGEGRVGHHERYNRRWLREQWRRR